jgi:hypothetical protein
MSEQVATKDQSTRKHGWGYNNEFRTTRTTVTYEYLWDECQRLIDKAAQANGQRVTVTI